MAFDQDNLDAIEKAIATGTLSVEVDGRRVTYRSIADLKDARDMIRADLRGSVGVQMVRPVFRRGL